MINLLLSGTGTVGKAFARLMSENNAFNIVGMTKSNGAFYSERGLDVDSVLAALDNNTCTSHKHWVDATTEQLIETGVPQILVEMGPTNVETGEPGTNNILKALNAGMHVLSCNKGPFVTKFKEIKELSKKKNKKILFDATVAGAIPLFSLNEYCLAGDTVLELKGILNGTTNYILSKMHQTKGSFDMILHEAQERGYAEADPTYDVEGIDAAIKLVIIGNTIFNKTISLNDVDITGISKITPDALEMADEEGLTIRLVAYTNGNIFRVAPTLIEKNSTLNVSGTLNVAHFNLKLASELTLIGRGAGGLETASALYNDLLALKKEEYE